MAEKEDAGMAGDEHNSGPSAADLDAASENLLDGIMARHAPGAAQDEPAKPQASDEPAAASAPAQEFSLPPDVDFVPPAAPADAKPGEAKPGEVKPGDAKPAEKPAPDFKDPKANHAFAELRSENSKMVKTLAEKEAEIAQLKATANPEQLQAKLAEVDLKYQKQIRELEERLGQYDLASTSSFKSKFDVPLNGLLQRVNSLVVKAGVESTEAAQLVRDLIGKSTIERAQTLQDLMPALSAPIVNILEDFDDLRGKRDAALRDWKASKESISEEQTRVSRTQAIELAETLVDQVVKQQEQVGNPFFRRSTAQPDWNAGVEQRIAKLRGLLKTGNQEVLAGLIAEGLTAQEFQKLYRGAQARLAALEQEVQDRFGMVPGARGRPETVATPPAKPRGSVSDEDLLAGIVDRHLRPITPSLGG